MLTQTIELFKFKDWLKEYRGMADSSIYAYFLNLKKYFSETRDNYLDIDNLNWFIARYTHKKRCTHYYSVLRAYVHFKTQNNVNKRQEIYDKLIHPKRYRSIIMERKYLPDDKLIEIINNIDDNAFRLVSLIQLLTARRAGDVLSLRRSLIDEEEYNGSTVLKLVLTGKGEKRSVVYLFDPVAIQLLSDYVKAWDLMPKEDFYEDYIFLRRKINQRPCTSNNLFEVKRYNYKLYWYSLKQAITLSGVVDKKKFATHDFRRCFSRKVWEKYRDIDVLQRVLDHENPSTTLRYLKQSGLQNIDIFKEMQNS